VARQRPPLSNRANSVNAVIWAALPLFYGILAPLTGFNRRLSTSLCRKLFSKSQFWC